jgi:hypothetical protein
MGAKGKEHLVHVAAGRVTLEADLSMPEGALGIVLFAHGSGSSRHSPRNRHVAQVLHEGRLATLLIDLLTLNEEAIDLHTARLRFGCCFNSVGSSCVCTRKLIAIDEQADDNVVH